MENEKQKKILFALIPIVIALLHPRFPLWHQFYNP